MAISIVAFTFMYKLPSRKSAVAAFARPVLFPSRERREFETVLGHVLLGISENVAFDAMSLV
jgi:hypothetical protein